MSMSQTMSLDQYDDIQMSSFKETSEHECAHL